MNVQKLRLPFFIMLFPFFFVFHGFTENYFFVSIKSALLLTAIYIAVSIVLAALFFLLSKNLAAATITAAFVMFIQFFFGFIQDFIKRISGNSFLSKYSFLLILFFILTWLLFRVLKKRKDLSNLILYLNILFLCLIFIDGVSLVTKTISSTHETKAQIPIGHKCDSCARPDFYIIMLDGYAGDHQLKSVFSYDNSPFFSQLAQRGFKTITSSESNYDSSPSSMAATLDMEYLTTDEINNMRRKGHQYAFKRINNNKLMLFLKAHGYTVFNYSIFKVMGQAAPIGGSFVPANARLINDNTLTSRLRKEVFINIATKLNLKSYLKRSLYAAKKDNDKLYGLTVENARSATGLPKIIYTHFMMPHHPYYYNEYGVFRNFEELSKIPLSDTAAYLSYLKFTNQKILSLVDSILDHSEKQPVIVVMSDHGFRYFSGKDYNQFAFSNLLSIHLPGKDYSGIPDTMTNVNLFRVILNKTFHQALPLLKDSSRVVEF